MNRNKKSLMEATLLALQGRLTESIDIELSDNGSTFVETDDATVIVQPKNTATVEYAEVPVAIDIEEPVIEEVPVQEVEVETEVEEIPVETEVDDVSIEETEEIVEESKTLSSTQDHTGKPKKEEVGAAAMLGAAALAGLAPAVTKRVQDVLGSIPGNNMNEQKELKIEDIANDSPENILKMLYNNYKDKGMELNFFNDLVNNTSITTDKIKEWYKQSELNESKKLQETGEWDDNDPEMRELLKTMKSRANELAKKINGKVISVKGFDKYQGPVANIESPKFGDVELWFDSEDPSTKILVGKTKKASDLNGYLRGTVSELADILNKDEINVDDVLVETKSTECGKETKSKFSSKSFGKAIEAYLKENNKIIESFKVTKANRTKNSLKIEGIITTTKNLKRNTILEFRKIQENSKFTKYVLDESRQLKLENKNNSKTIMVTNNKNNILECKYIKIR